VFGVHETGGVADDELEFKSGDCSVADLDVSGIEICNVFGVGLQIGQGHVDLTVSVLDTIDGVFVIGESGAGRGTSGLLTVALLVETAISEIKFGGGTETQTTSGERELKALMFITPDGLDELVGGISAAIVNRELVGTGGDNEFIRCHLSLDVSVHGAGLNHEGILLLLETDAIFVRNFLNLGSVI